MIYRFFCILLNCLTAYVIITARVPGISHILVVVLCAARVPGISHILVVVLCAARMPGISHILDSVQHHRPPSLVNRRLTRRLTRHQPSLSPLQPSPPLPAPPPSLPPTSLPLTSLPLTSLPLTSLPLTSLPLTSLPLTSLPLTSLQPASPNASHASGSCTSYLPKSSSSNEPMSSVSPVDDVMARHVGKGSILCLADIDDRLETITKWAKWGARYVKDVLRLGVTYLYCIAVASNGSKKVYQMVWN